jgi:hypothetical protein
MVFFSVGGWLGCEEKNKNSGDGDDDGINDIFLGMFATQGLGTICWRE